MNLQTIKTFFITWLVIIFLNQLIIFGGCFASYCILAALPHTGFITFLLFYFSNKTDVKDENVYTNYDRGTRQGHKEKKEAEKEKDSSRTNPYTSSINKKKYYTKKEQKNTFDPLKIKGDNYERYIGMQFEKKGDLVIYNGFIKGYEDLGVDIISISQKLKTIHLVQCKNWTKKIIYIDDIEKIYSKLNDYSLDFLTINPQDIKKELTTDMEISNIENILNGIEYRKYIFRKTLYISSDKVVNLNIGKHLKFIKTNIFQYNDMKIVVSID